MFEKVRRKRLEKFYAEAEKKKMDERQAFLDKGRDEDMSGITSSRELEDRVVGGTCAEHYGYSRNHFCDLSDGDLCACLKSYYAVRRGIGPGNPLFREIIEKYIEEWLYAFKNDETSSQDEKTLHAIRVAFIDLNFEAGNRFAISKIQSN